MEQPTRTGLTRILLADDHALVLEGLKQVLEEDFRIVGEAMNAHEAIRLSKSLRPDIVLMDITMPPMNGLEVTRQLKDHNPHLKTIIVTMHTEPSLVIEAFRAGAVGYVVKHNLASELINAIHTILRDQWYLSSSIPKFVRDQVEAHMAGMPSEGLSGHLTKRQESVLKLLAKGHTAKQVGQRLGISVRTVGFHTKNIMQALGLHTRAELTKHAIIRGLIVPRPRHSTAKVSQCDG